MPTLKPKKLGQMVGEPLKIGTFLNFVNITADKFFQNWDTW